MKYKIEITETLQRVIEVDAASSNEALSMVKAEYLNEKIVLDSDDFTIVEFQSLAETDLT